ncbi:hypothetical protein [Serratia sp. M24T3]|uniref:Secreted protein n=1 Tax=Rouxiella sp. WC2420 TaxID=3234145 RepID=A0AB39VKJ6_9GAMM|nr:hypothetical protein [Serratia sp. M24T3]EIC83430.1 hypothetical protein SPM24T3_16870 [Serratia sp. M24T3]
MHKIKLLGAAFVLMAAAGFSSTANADLLPIPPIPLPIPGLCSILPGLLPVGVPASELTYDQIIKILSQLPAGTSVSQVLSCL